MVMMGSSQRLLWRRRSRGSWFHDTCVVLYLLLTCMATTFSSAQYGFMIPSDPTIATGTTLELNCSLSDTVEDFNASSIVFTINDRPVPAEYVTVVGERDATMRYPNAQRNMTTNWFCYLPGHKKVGQQYVIVADIPVVPRITGCRVYNWENMTCTWLPKEQDTGLVTHQILYWTLSPSQGKVYHCPHPKVPKPGDNYCVWKAKDIQDFFHEGAIYYIYVESSNKVGKRHSNFSAENTNYLVQPNPPKELTVERNGKTHMFVTWREPIGQKEILYRVRYMSVRTQQWEERNTTSTSLNITELIPFTRYTIVVTCLPESFGGFWSDETRVQSDTLPSVPAVAPTIPPGGFRTSNDQGDATKRKVNIVWLSIPENLRNGEIVNYLLSYRGQHDDNNISREISPDTNILTDLVLDKEKTYLLTINGATSVGYNTSLHLNPLIIVKESSLPPKPGKLVAIAQEADTVSVYWRLVDDAEGYTVYWCKGSPQFSTCDDEVQWVSLDSNSTSYNVSLVDAESKKYIFGVSAEVSFEEDRMKRDLSSRVISSGIEWSDCTYDINSPVSKPQSVALAEHQNALSMSLKWTAQPCSETIYIDKYLVYYCPVQDSLCKEGGESEEANSIQVIEVDSSLDDFTITEPEHVLEPAQYLVWMRSYSSFKDGLSPPTKALVVDVYKSGPTKVVIAVSCIFGVFILFFIVFGIYQAYKMCQKKVKEQVTVTIERPPAVTTDLYNRRYDEDQDGDYMINIVDHDQNLSERNSLIKENQENQQREHPELNGDISSRPQPTTAPCFPAQTGDLLTAPSGGVSGYVPMDQIKTLEPSALLARVYLGNGSAENRKRKDAEGDGAESAVMTLLRHESEADKVEDNEQGLQDTAQPESSGHPSNGRPDGVAAGRVRKTSGANQQSAGSSIPSYSKCGLTDKDTGRGEEPIYQTIEGEQSGTSSPVSEQKLVEGDAPVTVPVTDSVGRQAPADSPTKAEPDQDQPDKPNSGYSAKTDYQPQSSAPSLTGGQGGSSVSAYCMMVPQTDYTNSPDVGENFPPASVAENVGKEVPAPSGGLQAPRTNGSDYQDIASCVAAGQIKPQTVEDPTISTGQPEKGTNPQLASQPSCSPCAESMTLNIKNNNNGYVTVNM